MGLLDDAIREHLELKRLRGGNPEEVSRKEREALGLPHGDVPAGSEEQASVEQPYDEPPSADDEQPAVETSGAQETVELDMNSVLASRDDARASETEAMVSETHEPSDIEESLDWEVHTKAAQTGQPKLRAGEKDEIEDVLEQTPDFLRDTPEQERLWFEQRPPRDFDFDE